jgi:hypothetical protein
MKLTASLDPATRTFLPLKLQVVDSSTRIVGGVAVVVTERMHRDGTATLGLLVRVVPTGDLTADSATINEMVGVVQNLMATTSWANRVRIAWRLLRRATREN